MNTLTVRLVHIVCFLIAGTLLAANAHAQGPVDDAIAHVGIGVGVSHYDPTNSDGQTSQGLAVAYRWHSFHSGWGPSVGLDWHSTNLDQTLGGVDATLGSFQMRGPPGRLRSYTSPRTIFRFGEYEWRLRLQQFHGRQRRLADVRRNWSRPAGCTRRSNSWVLKPNVAVWYDVLRHVGVGVGAAYLVARPSESITTVSGIQKQHLKTDAFELTAGVTFGMWKKKP